MKAYTLDQLAWFTEHGMERPHMLRAMETLGIDEEAGWTLWSSESTRKRDVVRLYWDYGGQYGAELDKYMDWCLAQHPDDTRTQAAAGAPTYSLGQLAWIHAVGLFRDDMVRGLEALGVPADDVEALTRAAAAHRTVLDIWTEQADRHGAVIASYLDACLVSYTPGWPHASATAETEASNDEEPAAVSPSAS
jgi:hypothetical protein